MTAFCEKRLISAVYGEIPSLDDPYEIDLRPLDGNAPAFHEMNVRCKFHKDPMTGIW